MSQKNLVSTADAKLSPPDAPGELAGFGAAVSGGLGALFAGAARFVLTGAENLSDRRAEARAARLTRRLRSKL